MVTCSRCGRQCSCVYRRSPGAAQGEFQCSPCVGVRCMYCVSDGYQKAPSQRDVQCVCGSGKPAIDCTCPVTLPQETVTTCVVHNGRGYSDSRLYFVLASKKDVEALLAQQSPEGHAKLIAHFDDGTFLDKGTGGTSQPWLVMPLESLAQEMWFTCLEDPEDWHNAFAHCDCKAHEHALARVREAP